MQCPECGHEIRAKTLFCPNCGHKVEVAAAPQPDRTPDPEAPESVGSPTRPGCGLSLGVLLIAALVVLGIVGLGLGGAYLGLRDRARVERQAAEEHYQKGVAHMALGEYELAEAELAAVWQLDPTYRDVAAQLELVRQRLAVAPTPTAVLKQEINAVYLEKVRAAYDQQDWEQVLALADELITLDASYARVEVDQMLFGAFYNLGRQREAEDRMQEAVRYYERALVLQPGDAQVSHAKDLAVLYVDGIAYWGADWERASEQFGVLHALEPGYKDVRARTYEAFVNYAEQLAAAEDWCGAREQYTRAIEVITTADIVGARQEADERCRAGTPTPTVETTPGPDETATVTVAGTYVGSIAKSEAVDPTKILIRGKVLDRAGKGVGGTRVQIQAWGWTAIAVTDGMGQYSFDGLANPVTYTLTLLDVRSLPLDVPSDWGKLVWVDFQETR